MNKWNSLIFWDSVRATAEEDERAMEVAKAATAAADRANSSRKKSSWRNSTGMMQRLSRQNQELISMFLKDTVYNCNMYHTHSLDLDLLLPGFTTVVPLMSVENV
jgi:hypothetical protein